MSLIAEAQQALAADSPVRSFFGWLNGLAAEAQRYIAPLTDITVLLICVDSIAK